MGSRLITNKICSPSPTQLFKNNFQNVPEHLTVHKIRKVWRVGRSKMERKGHLKGAKKCDDFDGCEWGMGKIERKGISEGRGVATWAPHRANKMRRRCTVAKYCASVMTKITYQRRLSRRLFAFCLSIQLSFHYRHVEEGGTIPHILIMPTIKGFASDIWSKNGEC